MGAVYIYVYTQRILIQNIHQPHLLLSVHKRYHSIALIIIIYLYIINDVNLLYLIIDIPLIMYRS